MNVLAGLIYKGSSFIRYTFSHTFFIRVFFLSDNIFSDVFSSGISSLIPVNHITHTVSRRLRTKHLPTIRLGKRHNFDRT